MLRQEVLVVLATVDRGKLFPMGPSKVLCLQKKNVEKEQKNSKSINTINP